MILSPAALSEQYCNIPVTHAVTYQFGICIIMCGLLCLSSLEHMNVTVLKNPVITFIDTTDL
jgi:hypothetical protein